MDLVLASTSKYRCALLARLGLPFESVAPPFDEEAAKTALAHLDPEALSLALARGKALSVARTRPGAIVIGSDQIATIDGAKLDKPGTAERARAQLRLLAGRTHRLVTSVVAARGDDFHEHVDVHELTLRPLTDAQIARYVAADAPLDCAGSYRSESLGVALFESVRGEDATAVVGLPLVAVTRLLARLGLDPLG
ncbi:MAG: Maf family nucleotide pyrophosphatase [Sandaracinaceae bacterium]